jgi:hypothetical protein
MAVRLIRLREAVGNSLSARVKVAATPLVGMMEA